MVPAPELRCHSDALTNTGRQQVFSHAWARNKGTAVLLTAVTAVPFPVVCSLFLFQCLESSRWVTMAAARARWIKQVCVYASAVKSSGVSSSLSRSPLCNLCPVAVQVKWADAFIVLLSLLIYMRRSLILLVMLFTCKFFHFAQKENNVPYLWCLWFLQNCNVPWKKQSSFHPF